MVISHNMLALNAYNQLNITSNNKAKSTEKLSSGYKINRAADDAAGLSISEKMRHQIKGIERSSLNAEEGVSLAQTADGALDEVTAMLQRGNELSIQAANGTNSESDRKAIKEELEQINTEIARISDSTKFNEVQLFPKDGSTEYVAEIASRHGKMVSSAVYNMQPMTITDSYEISFDAKNEVFSIASYSVPANGIADSGSVLADKIANEYFPNAISQILDAYPALNVGSFDLGLNIGYVDGENNKLAYASCRLSARNENSNMVGFAYDFSFTVDTSDFNDNDALGTGDRAGLLESTIAHELTHSLMQNAFPAYMAENNTISSVTTKANDASFPLWFKEGVAQLSGGGMYTGQGWNNALANIARTLQTENDTARDGDIATVLKSRTTADNPYGQGYLTSAYIGYLASGANPMVTSSDIASGINNVFTYLQTHDASLEDAVNALTGRNLSSIVGSMDSGAADAVQFVRKLAYASRNGNGSVITGLEVGGKDLLGNMVSPSQINKYKITEISIETDDAVDENVRKRLTGTVKGIALHVGTESDMDNKIPIMLYSITPKMMEIDPVEMENEMSATKTITKYGNALEYVNYIRSYYGAVQNRLEHTIANLDNVGENTTAAESRIRDTDMADEMVKYSMSNILEQSGQSMLAQANQSVESVLALLQ